MAERNVEPPPNGFLSRWSRRKIEARQGVAAPEPAPRVTAPDAAAVPTPIGDSTPGIAGADRRVDRVPPREPVGDVVPLSLDDVQALTAESDFSPFMARGVAPGVRNAAMKKLFADPRFNVMDGLDTYIDDYSQTTPLPAAMLGRMASAQVLGLFNESAAAGEAPAETTGAADRPSARQGLGQPVAGSPPQASDDPATPTGKLEPRQRQDTEATDGARASSASLPRHGGGPQAE